MTQLAEVEDLKSFCCGFESHSGYEVDNTVDMCVVCSISSPTGSEQCFDNLIENTDLGAVSSRRRASG